MISCTAQAFVVGWGLWGSFVAFLQSLWWHFLDAKNLGLSIYAVGVLFSLTVLVGLLAFALNLCIESARPCLKFFICHHWIWQGAVPACAMAIALYPDPHVRTAATATASASAVLGQHAAMAGNANGKLSQRTPACMTLGILILHSMRIGWSSATPTLDYGYAPWHLYGCAFGFIAAVSLYLEEAALTSPLGTKLDPDSDANVEEKERRSRPNCKSGRLCWAWLFAGPLLAGSTTLTLAYFTHPGAMPKYVGWAPFPGSLVVIFGIVLGWTLCAGIASQESSAKALLPLTVAARLFIGSLLLFFAHSIVGAFVLALTFPSMWMLVWFELVDMARQLAIGRSFLFAGLLVFVHIFCYVGVLTFGNTPVLGVVFGGRSDLWGALVVLPMIFGMLALSFLDRDDKARQDVLAQVILPKFCDGRAGKLLPGVETYGCGDAQNSSLAVILTLMLLPAIACRALNQARVGLFQPTEGELTVMTFNNQNGYDTAGHFNGACFADSVTRHDADYVSVAEGDSMHFNTGNRDALEYAASDLAYFVDYGPPGYAGVSGYLRRQMP